MDRKEKLDKAALRDILAEHKAWLSGEKGSCANLSYADLSYANLSRANLSGANLSYADLSYANLSRADLSYANLSRANLSGANLSRADLSYANLSRANLSRANLSYADLSYANLSRANLSGANLSRANLGYADLSYANLSRANLSYADLRDANLSYAVGLTEPAEWIKQHFEADNEGIIVYKQFGAQYRSPNAWQHEEGAVITEVCNPSRTTACACGVNVATLEWIKKNGKETHSVWRCRIAWIDLAGAVVPYHTDGKFRCSRLTLLEKIKDNQNGTKTDQD